MATLYVVLFIAIASGIMQASLDKAGIGRIEEITPSIPSSTIVIFSLPLTFISNLGLIAVTIGSLFILPFTSTIILVLSTFIGFFLVWGSVIAKLRRSEAWDNVISVGIPLVFFLRLVCAISVVFLSANYVQ